MPTLTVVAGPNGSGKSTLTRTAREVFQDSPILDPDAIARKLRVSSPSVGTAIDAGREVLSSCHRLMAVNESFLVETTLSGNTYLRMMAQAKKLGYVVELIFVGTVDVEINIERVRQRVRDGGHDVPEIDQRRRFPRSLSNLRRAFDIADFAVLFDNSGESHRRLVVKNGEELRIFTPLPDWPSFLNFQ